MIFVGGSLARAVVRGVMLELLLGIPTRGGLIGLFGSAIGPPKQADLVVIKGDPSKNIEEIENVETVFQAGIG
jgi:hypothetical protein